VVRKDLRCPSRGGSLLRFPMGFGRYDGVLVDRFDCRSQ